MSSIQKAWQEAYLERFYPQTSWRRDGTRDFFQMLQEYCGGRILEIGAGPSNATSDYLPTLGDFHGLDFDSEVLHNRGLKRPLSSMSTFHFPRTRLIPAFP